MVDLTQENYLTNARLLLHGFWYAELPDLLDINILEESIEDIFDEIENGQVKSFKQDTDDFILDFSRIVSPPYIRAPGVEAISFFDFKKNNSLREMQIPNLLHYIAFIYNTLLNFESLFQTLYLNSDNAQYVANSNSYLVFEDEFVLHSYDGDDNIIAAGVFTTKNNKISTSAALTENKKRLLVAEADYLYSLKMDIESFFPNLYTHNFEKMANKIPFSKLDADFRYFQFLDRFHQRINNNQTKGIPAGTFSSHIAAELCMLCVDEEIRTYLKNCKNPVGYVRYVDDLNFFSDSESELAELYPAIQSILNKYRLRINGNKTEAFRHCVSAGNHLLSKGRISSCAMPFSIDKLCSVYSLQIENSGWIPIHDPEITGFEINRRLNNPTELCRYCSSRLEKYKWEQSQRESCDLTDWIYSEVQKDGRL